MKISKFKIALVASMTCLVLVFAITLLLLTHFNSMSDVGFELMFYVDQISSVRISKHPYSNAKSNEEFVFLNSSESSHDIPTEKIKAFNNLSLNKYTDKTFDYNTVIIVDGIPKLLINTDANLGYFNVKKDDSVTTYYFELTNEIQQIIDSLS